MNRDETVIRRCLAGERDAFGMLVERYESAAIGHALVVLGNREDALDAVQEAFLDAFRGLGRFDRRRPFYPWFYVILRNRCYKLLAARRKQPSRSLDESRCAILEGGGNQPNAVEAALAELSPPDREMITLKHLDGLTYEELAQRLEIPVGTVMSRLYRARQRLRQILDDSDEIKGLSQGIQ